MFKLSEKSIPELILEAEEGIQTVRVFGQGRSPHQNVQGQWGQRFQVERPQFFFQSFKRNLKTKTTYRLSSENQKNYFNFTFKLLSSMLGFLRSSPDLVGFSVTKWGSLSLVVVL